MQKYNKASSEIDYARIFAFVFDRAKGTRIKVFRCPATIQKTGAFRVECAHDKYFRRKRIGWQTYYKQLPKELNPIVCKNIIRNLNKTDNAERNQFTQNGSFTYFDRLSFHVQNEKKHIPFSVTKLNIVHTGVFVSQPNNYHWITGPENSKSRCFDDKESLIDKGSWSKIIGEISLDVMIN